MYAYFVKYRSELFTFQDKLFPKGKMLGGATLSHVLLLTKLLAVFSVFATSSVQICLLSIVYFI
jgi:hypothetical protein